MKQFSAERAVDFLQYGIQLKKVPRAGWLLKGINEPESVSEHCQNTGTVALVLARAEGVDERKVLLAAFIHDIGEAIMGDVIWEQGAISNKRKQAEKHITEVEAVHRICDLVDHDELKDLLIDFLEQRTPEARIVKEADKLEMVLQALDYEEQVADPSTLLEFWENAAKYLKSESAWLIFEELKSRSKIKHQLPSRPAR